jgi:hypothetical protein
VPGVFLLALVRTKILWLFVLPVLTVACIVAAVATALSDDAQAGLAMLLIPSIGGIAAFVAACSEAVLRRSRRRPQWCRQRTT